MCRSMHFQNIYSGNPIDFIIIKWAYSSLFLEYFYNLINVQCFHFRICHSWCGCALQDCIPFGDNNCCKMPFQCFMVAATLMIYFQCQENFSESSRNDGHSFLVDFWLKLSKKRQSVRGCKERRLDQRFRNPKLEFLRAQAKIM